MRKTLPNAIEECVAGKLDQEENLKLREENAKHLIAKLYPGPNYFEVDERLKPKAEQEKLKSSQTQREDENKEKKEFWRTLI